MARSVRLFSLVVLLGLFAGTFAFSSPVGATTTTMRCDAQIDHIVDQANPTTNAPASLLQTNSTSNNQVQSYIQVECTGAPNYTNIVNVRLWVYALGSTDNLPNCNWSEDHSWGTSTITWSNKPLGAGTNVDMGAAGSAGWNSCTFTGQNFAYTGGGDYVATYIMKGGSTTNQFFCPTYDGSIHWQGCDDANTSPYLEITYNV